MGLDRLAGVSDEALWERLEAVRLARPDGSTPVLTRAAALLVRIGRPAPAWSSAPAMCFCLSPGNLFGVLDRVLEALDELNQPFRLKAPTSADLRRFDPRAIKEVVVNALAHRDHDQTRAPFGLKSPTGS